MHKIKAAQNFKYNEIIIIIPTYNRPSMLKRAISYWSSYPVKLLILDGSNTPSLNEDEILAAKNIEYHHLTIPIEDRFLFAANRLCGRYAAVLADDDFYVYSALSKAASILNASHNVSAVIGETLAFKKVDRQILFKRDYSTANTLDISSLDPQKRLTQRAQVTGNTIFYALTRVDILKTALKFIGERRYSCPYIMEYQMEAIFCCAGSIKVMPELMWFRNRDGSMVSNAHYDRNILFNEWLRNPNNLSEINELSRSFEHHSEKFLQQGEVSGEALISLYRKFEAKACESSRMKNLLRIVYAHCPEPCRKTIDFIESRLTRKRSNKYTDISEALKTLKSLDITYDHNEVKSVLENIQAY